MVAEGVALEKLVQRYGNVPMSLADACLVRLAKLHPRSVVFTLDRDFQIYRKDGRQPIPLLTP
jgi:predicted nucleic acid-binding protein